MATWEELVANAKNAAGGVPLAPTPVQTMQGWGTPAPASAAPLPGGVTAQLQAQGFGVPQGRTAAEADALGFALASPEISEHEARIADKAVPVPAGTLVPQGGAPEVSGWDSKVSAARAAVTPVAAPRAAPAAQTSASPGMRRAGGGGGSRPQSAADAARHGMGLDAITTNTKLAQGTGNAMVEQGINREADAGQQRAQGEAQAWQEQRDNAVRTEAEMQMRQAAQRQEQDKRLGALAAANAELDKNPVKHGTAWASRTGGEQFMAHIGIALSTFGSALAGGPNLALENLKEQEANAVADQVSKYEQKKDRITGMTSDYAKFRQAGLDDDEAQLATLNRQHAMTDAKIREIAANSQSDVVRANAEKALGERQATAAETQAKLEQTVGQTAARIEAQRAAAAAEAADRARNGGYSTPELRKLGLHGMERLQDAEAKRYEEEGKHDPAKQKDMDARAIRGPDGAILYAASSGRAEAYAKKEEAVAKLRGAVAQAKQIYAAGPEAILKARMDGTLDRLQGTLKLTEKDRNELGQITSTDEQLINEISTNVKSNDPRVLATMGKRLADYDGMLGKNLSMAARSAIAKRETGELYEGEASTEPVKLNPIGARK